MQRRSSRSKFDVSHKHIKYKKSDTMARHVFVSLIVFSILVFFFESCKTEITPNGKIKLETYIHQFSDTTIVDTLFYSYDQQGRVVLIQHINGQERYVFTADSCIYIPISGAIIRGTLNHQGLVTSASDGYTYTYNQNGYRISSMSPNLSSYYSIINGNILSDSQVNYGHSSIQEYTYSSIVDYRDFGTYFGGKQNLNLTLRDSIIGRPATIISYTFDSKGRVSTSTTSGNGILFINTYSYFD